MTAKTVESGKVAITFGTILVMSVLVIIAGVAAVAIVSNFYVIFDARILKTVIGFWPYFWLTTSIVYVAVLFSAWHPIVAKLNKLFLNWK